MEFGVFFSIIVISGCLILFFIKRHQPKLSKRDLKLCISVWRQINNIKKSHPEKAILEADKLLDSVLRKLGYKGSLGHKLKSYPQLFSDINAVWQAHKLRNRIAHEVGFIPTKQQTNTAIGQFKTALYDLGITL